MATVIYDLECEFAHRFEGWFRSLQDFENQKQASLLQCPQCGSGVIRKVPSRLNIGQSRQRVETSSPPSQSGVATVAPDQVHAKPAANTQSCNEHPQADSTTAAAAFMIAKKAVQAILANTEDVGTQFAEEARKIHYEETPARAIRGHASRQEVEELKEEGISVLPLPLLPRDEDLN